MSTAVTTGSPSAPSTPSATPRNRKPGNGRRIALYAALVALTLLFVSPLLYMLSTAFKTRTGAVNPTPQWIPNPFTTSAFDSILGAAGTPVFRWFLNSIIAASFNALLVVVTASMAAYALARLEFRGKKILFSIIIATLFIPPIILLIPNYLIVGELKWLDTLMAVIVPTAAGAFGVFFMRQFFVGLPMEIEEAALLDGANRWQIFSKVIIPLSRPALVTLALLSFLTNWNDFLWPVYVLFSPEKQTLQAGLATLQSANSVRYDLLMAGALIASVPVLALFTVMQRFVIEGVSRSGLKG